MRKWLFLLMAFLFLGAIYYFGFYLADLQNAVTKKNDSLLGKQWLDRMYHAHGLDNWRDVETVTLDWVDEFSGFGRFINPYASSKISGQFHFAPGTYDSRLDVSDGLGQAQSWGIQSGFTYSVNEKQVPQFADNWEAWFWLPTYQYFVMMPIRIREADVVAYAGTKQVDGKTLHGVFASWKSADTQKDIDQYLLWIDEESHQLVTADFTIRDMLGAAVGYVNYANYFSIDGLLLPGKIAIYSPPLPGKMHEMKIARNVQKNKLSLTELQPRADLLEAVGSK